MTKHLTDTSLLHFTYFAFSEHPAVIIVHKHKKCLPKQLEGWNITATEQGIKTWRS